ncbi:allantoinase PuuE [Aureimonas fodinaquatilis]|uniref:Chitooligosaccharide deacetylase n=1 Tax=Aureimonas fodinaquatilis TaxID=2565783 RepID=A0A5B0DQ82_9HYPH|nr:allantoinase PuuE [Aureimonas fodinaquatilis]KAA0968628.1 allantoinase PuuE [Aureimonas fodinaquatilis]
MTKSVRYPRDLRGYGRTTPDPRWPGQAKICVQFVINYEEGGENSILHGDAASEAFLSEIVGAQPWPGQRHMNMESIYEYGARAGFWRLWRMFTARNLPVTVYGVATALEKSPEQVAAMQEAGWEIASHGLKWIDYRDFTMEAERADMLAAIALHTAVTGEAPKGWYTGRSSPHTIELTAEQGFAYSSDVYADDLPYWQETRSGPLLMLPYTLDSNDMRFAAAQGFNSGDQFFSYLKDSFDTLYAEGAAGAPKMLNIGLHCRLVGRPGRAASLARFIDYVLTHDKVWVARRIDIANHWRTHFPYKPGLMPSHMERPVFLSLFGGVFEHSSFIAERAYDKGLLDSHDTATGLASGLTIQFRLASEAERLGILQAHPDLAGRLALANVLTADSRSEQASAGLDQLTPEELTEFTELNSQYQHKFGFPFIIAVRGLNKQSILEAFRQRVGNTREVEFAQACAQVEKIARLRINAIFATE